MDPFLHCLLSTINTNKSVVQSCASLDVAEYARLAED